MRLENIGLLLAAAVVIGDYIPIAFGRFGGLLLTPARVFIIIFAGISLYLSFKNQRIFITWLDVSIFFLLILLMISVAWSIAPEASVRRSNDLMFFLLFYASLIIHLKNRSNVTQLMWYLSFVGIILAIYGLTALSLGGISRYVLAGISRNDFSRTAIGLLPLLATSTVLAEGKIRYLFAITFAALIFLVPTTGSRSGLVALIFVLVLLTFVYLSKQNNYSTWEVVTVGVSLLVGLVVVGMIGVKFQFFPDRLTKVPLSPSGFTGEVLGEKRFEVYQAEVTALRKYWLTGMGYGAFTYWTDAVYKIGSFQAHDPISRVWLGTGIGGVIILFYATIGVIKRYISTIMTMAGVTQYYATASLIGLLAITLAGMANIVITESLLYVFLAVGANGIIRSDSV